MEENNEKKVKNKSNILVGVLLIIIGIAMYVVGAIVLPDSIGTQIGANGQMGNTMNKYVGLLIPLVLTSGFGALLIKKMTTKYLIISIVGIIASVLLFVFNL